MQWPDSRIEKAMTNRNDEDRSDDKENLEGNELDERPTEDLSRNDEPEPVDDQHQDINHHHEINPHDLNHDDMSNHHGILQTETESHPDEEIGKKSPRYDDEDDLERHIKEVIKEDPMDPKTKAQLAIIHEQEPTTDLELALTAALKRKETHIERLSNEVHKLKAFISKRKQTYKRKRKDEGAPTRALSAYNIFVQDRFAELAKQNEEALNSADTEAVMKRVPPANLVASTGNQWKELSAEEKAKYEERAKSDRKRYEEQMAQYQPPDKQSNRKRNKTGYNMFFSAHVLRLKQTEAGVPSERGSVARLVGNAWKQLSGEEKQYYEREADKHNGMNPLDKDGDDDDDDERKHMIPDPYGHMHAPHPDMHMHPGMPPPMHAGMQHPQHDPRHHGYAPYPTHHMYGQPYAHYDYSQHHPRHQQGRSSGYSQGYPPPQGHPYDRGMPM